jgi:hypothetical protein
MLKTVPGTFKSGVVELTESFPNLPEGPVLVTFLTGGAEEPANTPSLSPSQISELRGKLSSWEADWNAPGMEAYDKP